MHSCTIIFTDEDRKQIGVHQHKYLKERFFIAARESSLKWIQNFKLSQN